MNKSLIDKDPNDSIVKLLPLPEEPDTAVERLAVAMLRRENAIPFRSLVNRIAGELYQNEIAHGGWVVDLGVIGGTLFVPEVSQKIHAGNGKFWQIEKHV
jgi:hypothetical protein